MKIKFIITPTMNADGSMSVMGYPAPGELVSGGGFSLHIAKDDKLQDRFAVDEQHEYEIDLTFIE